MADDEEIHVNTFDDFSDDDDDDDFTSMQSTRLVLSSFQLPSFEDDEVKQSVSWRFRGSANRICSIARRTSRKPAHTMLPEPA